MIDKERFEANLKKYGITLTNDQFNRLDLYAEILVNYNEKVNLTAITDPLGIENKHFVDSLLFAANERVQGSLIDVGTGAGFPGIVAKIFKPSLELTLLEPTGKRCTFLQYALDTLGLKGTVLKERAEEAARKGYREKYDVATARAVADLRVLSEYCLPLVKVGGYFIAMKGEASAELDSAKAALSRLGAKFEETVNVALPDDSRRSLIVCKKVSPTPSAYPRNGGKIAKSPL